MKLKKITFVMILGIVFAWIWFLALKKVSRVDDVKEQRSMVKQAEVFLSKKLYIRAIPILEKALKVKTEENGKIQKILLKAYFDFGDDTSYIGLLEDMSEEGNIEEIDYLRMVTKLYEQNKIKEGLQLAKRGINYYKNSSLYELYERHRFDIEINTVKCEMIRAVPSFSYIPIYSNGEWRYINGNGDEKIKLKAAEVTAFNKNGYAVVKREGRFEIIVRNGELYSIDETGLDEVKGLTNTHIIAKKDGLYGFYNFDFELINKNLKFQDISLDITGERMVKKEGKWGIISEKGEMNTDYIFEDVAFNSLGYVFCLGKAMVKKNGRWILINDEGKEVIENSFDDAKAPESEGYIAVANEKGKWGFIDYEGNKIIDYIYDDAKSFSDGLAAVKKGDKWSYISKSGRRVIKREFDDALPFEMGMAIGKDDLTYSILSYKYYKID